MFKKILQSLSRSQSAKDAPPVAPPPRTNSVLDKIVKGAPVPVAAIRRTPEELCEIPAKMPREQIQARLKLLYRRYNRSASSLNPKLRAEADKMLDAIVTIREKHFGEI